MGRILLQQVPGDEHKHTFGFIIELELQYLHALHCKLWCHPFQTNLHGESDLFFKRGSCKLNEPIETWICRFSYVFRRRTKPHQYKTIKLAFFFSRFCLCVLNCTSAEANKSSFFCFVLFGTWIAQKNWSNTWLYSKCSIHAVFPLPNVFQKFSKIWDNPAVAQSVPSIHPSIQYVFEARGWTNKVRKNYLVSRRNQIYFWLLWQRKKKALVNSIGTKSQPN